VGIKAGSALIRHFGSLESLVEAVAAHSKVPGSPSADLTNLMDLALKGVRISRSNVTRSLMDAETMATVTLFKKLLKLQDEVPMPGVNINFDHDVDILSAHREGDPQLKTSRFTGSARKALTDTKSLTTSDFKFRGEEADASTTLGNISPGLIPVLDSLRNLYPKLSRFEP
jgi:hypothetical protein